MALENEAHGELSRETVLAEYQAYRELITQEASLINQRMSWFVAIQSFSLVSFALLSNGLAGTAFILTATVIALFSITMSVSFWASYRAANAALAEIEAKWVSYSQSYAQSDSGLGTFVYARMTAGQPWFRDANVLPIGISVIWISFLIVMWTLDTTDLNRVINELGTSTEGEQPSEKPPWEERPGPMINE
ncbi:MAG: hypothetical protein AB3N09_06535 [Tateyamaria sp.]